MTEKAPMCWVMPPASEAVTEDLRRARRVVFPWLDVAHDGYDGGTEGDAGGIFGHGSRSSCDGKDHTEGIDQGSLSIDVGFVARVEGNQRSHFIRKIISKSRV